MYKSAPENFQTPILPPVEKLLFTGLSNTDDLTENHWFNLGNTGSDNFHFVINKKVFFLARL